MRPDQAVAFVARAEAEEKLLAKGWTNGPCKACDGRGTHPLAEQSELPVVVVPSRVCESCGGSMWVWMEPKK